MATPVEICARCGHDNGSDDCCQTRPATKRAGERQRQALSKELIRHRVLVEEALLIKCLG